MRTLRFRKMSVSSDGIDVDERLVGATDWFLIVSTSPRTRRVLRFFFFLPPTSVDSAGCGRNLGVPAARIDRRRAQKHRLGLLPPASSLPLFPHLLNLAFTNKKKATTFDQIIPHRTFHILCGSSRISGEFPLVPFPFQTNRPLNESRLRAMYWVLHFKKFDSC